MQDLNFKFDCMCFLNCSCVAVCKFFFFSTFQTLLVLFFSDLLQHAHAAQLKTAKVKCEYIKMKIIKVGENYQFMRTQFSFVGRSWS